MNRENLKRVAGAVLLFVVVFTCAVSINFDIPFGGYGFMAAFVFYLVLEPRGLEVVKIVLLAALLLAANRAISVSGQQHINIATACAMLGLATFLIVGLRALQADEFGRSKEVRVLAPAAVMTAFILTMVRLPNLALALNPKTLDLYTYVFDGSLGFQPSFAIGALVWHTPWLKTLVAFSYDAVSLAIVGSYAANLRRSPKPLWRLMLLFALAGITGYFLYLLFPVTGPGYAFPSYYPDHPLPRAVLGNLSMELIPVSEYAARNGVPSLHMAWTVLAWWSLRGLPRWVRLLGFAWVLVTIFDTLGAGEHYMVDLVVALPFSLIMLALAAAVPWRSSRRIIPIVAGIAIYAGWLLLVRFGSSMMLQTPALPWALIAITVAATETLRRRLPLLTEEFESVRVQAVQTSA